MNTSSDIQGGLLRPELLVGTVTEVSSSEIEAELVEAGLPTGSHFSGARYGRGEVGELVLIEGEQGLALARVVSVRSSRSLERVSDTATIRQIELPARAKLQLLGGVSMESLEISPGVELFPRLRDRVYSAPCDFLSAIPLLMGSSTSPAPRILIELGKIGHTVDSPLRIPPEALFGRHCAILGTTGGGKSWTTARLLEECIQHRSKQILLDPTGEYRTLTHSRVKHVHLGAPIQIADGSQEICLNPTSFVESDFLALFRPAGKVQGPVLRSAIRSLRIASLAPQLANHSGLIEKAGKEKQPIVTALQVPEIASKVDDPQTPFNVHLLSRQIENECVWPTAHGANGAARWGNRDDNQLGYCLSLLTRIEGALRSPSLSCVFGSQDRPNMLNVIEEFFQSEDRLLRICLSGIGFEYRAREIVANALGRQLLVRQRSHASATCPVVLFVDEAHNFIGGAVGDDDEIAKLDAFEQIAREGRKFGLMLVLASQRPRDLGSTVLSQVGTTISHRLTNPHDREVIEKGSSTLDRTASQFLPTLQPGEAVLLGVDLPIPLTMTVSRPSAAPASDGPDFQSAWLVQSQDSDAEEAEAGEAGEAGEAAK